MWARAVVAAEKRLRGRLAVGVFSLFSAGPVQSLRPAAELSRRRPRRRARMRKLPRRRWLHLVNCERYHKSTVTLGRRPAIAARKISIRLSGERTMRRLRLFIAIRSGEIPHGSTSGSRQRRRRSQDRIERDHAIDERPCRDSGAGARIHTPSFSPRRRRLVPPAEALIYPSQRLDGRSRTEFLTRTPPLTAALSRLGASAAGVQKQQGRLGA
jgi:hypothetical protein